MHQPNNNTVYLFVLKCFHWSIAITIIGQILIGIIATRLSSAAAIHTLFFIHKSLGLTLLLLGIAFILWRFCHKHPNKHSTVPTWQRISAKIVHHALFTLIIIMPLSGWFMSTAAGYPPSFWGLVTIKAPVPVSASLAATMSEIHIVCAWIMVVLIVIHTLAALKHALIDHDDTLKRMWF